MGSFRLAAGRGHLHPRCNFAESLVETVRMLLCHSCRSELTRQGISLESFSTVSRRVGLYLDQLLDLVRSTAIHLLGHAPNFFEPVGVQMVASLHHQEYPPELFEV